MKLLTKEIENKMPPLYSNEDKKPEDIPIIVKFFYPGGAWTWYATEGQWEDGDYLFFGLVRGFEAELGYFSLKQLMDCKGHYGLRVERDIYFGDHTLAEAMKERI